MKMKDIYATLRLVGGQEAVNRFKKVLKNLKEETGGALDVHFNKKHFSTVVSVLSYSLIRPISNEQYWRDLVKAVDEIEQKLKKL